MQAFKKFIKNIPSDWTSKNMSVCPVYAIYEVKSLTNFLDHFKKLA